MLCLNFDNDWQFMRAAGSVFHCLGVLNSKQFDSLQEVARQCDMCIVLLLVDELTKLMPINLGFIVA